MTDGEKPKSKGGRPRKFDRNVRNPTLAFRVRGDLYERLKVAAEAAGRSLSEEIERRVDQSFAAESYGSHNANVGGMVAQILSSVEARTGQSWVGDEVLATYAFTRLRIALEAYMGATNPEHLHPAEGEGQNKLLDAMGLIRSPERIEELKSAVSLAFIDEGRHASTKDQD